MLNLVNLPHVPLDAANIANCLYWFNVSNYVLCFPGESRSNRWQRPFTSHIILLLGLLHIIGGRRNGFEFLYYTSSSSWTSALSIYLIHESFQLVLYLPIRLLPGYGASNILLSTCPSPLLRVCPYHFGISSVYLSDCKAIHIRQDVGQRTLIIILVRHFSDFTS